VTAAYFDNAALDTVVFDATVSAITKVSAETLGMNETSLRRLWSIRLESEVVGIVEAKERWLKSVRLAAETVGLTELQSFRMWSIRLIAETIGITDSMIRMGWKLVKVGAETVGILSTAVRRGLMVKFILEPLRSVCGRKKDGHYPGSSPPCARQ